MVLSKRFQNYDLGGHRVEDVRFPYQSAFKNLSHEHLQFSMSEHPVNKPAVQKVRLKPLGKETRLYVRSNEFIEPLKLVNKPGCSGFSEFLKSHLKYEQSITKGYHARVTSNRLPDPFKLHQIDFETSKDNMLSQRLLQKHEDSRRLLR